MKTKIENVYGGFMKGILYSINPIKKLLKKTYCTVHKFINKEAIELLKQNNYYDEYEFYKKNTKYLNFGVVWADQDFKSSNHFYNLKKEKGLYGFSNALFECEKYYNKACRCYEISDYCNSLFYLGAACHLLQDVTVPHHINNNLFKGHRAFELWVLNKGLKYNSFKAYGDIIKYYDIKEYIDNNALLSREVYNKYKYIDDKEKRYKKTIEIIILQAQRTTAGLLLKFYEENKKINLP